jgi:UDP-2,4-diacetamido-2,4,6-trideoxy-beta-L-altropyranose hydrolase
MKVAIRVDASQRIGTGHVARCITLAAELKRQGGQVLFVCRHLTEFLRNQIQAGGHEVALLSRPVEGFGGDRPHGVWLGVSQNDDAADTVAQLRERAPFDWLVVDHYALDARWETTVREVVRAILVIDDIADRPHLADMLLDQNLQRGCFDRYAGLLPNDCRRLIGPRYALLRPEFHVLATHLPERRDRLNIFFGGVDPAGVTVRALEAIAKAGLNSVPIDIVVGQDNPHRDMIAALATRMANSVLHIQPSNLGAIMAGAQLALGAGGATSWERCCLGVPTALVSIAENQKNSSQALAAARAAIYLGDIADVTAQRLARAVRQMLAHPRLLGAMSRRAAALVDGCGTERVVEAMACA